MKVSIPALGPASINILPKIEGKTHCVPMYEVGSAVNCNFPGGFSVAVKNFSLYLPGGANKIMTIGPAGYYYQGEWRALDGTTVRQFNSATAILQCLKGKSVHMYGDSTVRQWFEYLTKKTPGGYGV